MRNVPNAPATVDLCNPIQARAWLTALRATVLDGMAAGEDATRRPKKRMFSRFEVRRRIDEASAGAQAMLDAAERGRAPLP